MQYRETYTGTPSQIASDITQASRAIQWRLAYLMAVENGNRDPGKRNPLSVRKKLIDNCAGIADIKTKYRGQPTQLANILKSLLRYQSKERSSGQWTQPYDRKVISELTSMRSSVSNIYFVLRVLNILWIEKSKIERIILNMPLKNNH